MFSKQQRYEGIKRNYSQADVERLRGSLKIEHTLARRGSIKLWNYLTRGGNSYINALGALTGKTDSDKWILMEHPVVILFWHRVWAFHVKDTLFPNMVKATTGRAIRLGFAANLHSVREIDNLNAFVNFSCFFRIQRIKFEKKHILSLVTATSTEQNRMTWKTSRSWIELWTQRAKAQKFQFFHFISSTQYLIFKNWNLHPKVTFTDAFGSKFLI